MKPAQAGALTTPPPGSCRAASSTRIASRALWSVVSLAESAAFVAYEASAASALEAWSAETPVSRLASCAATRPQWRGPALHLLSWCPPPVECPTRPPWRAGRVSALPARAASRAAVVMASRRAAAILESTPEEVSTAKSLSGRWRPEACSPAMEACRLASSEASAAAVTAPRRWPPWCLPPAA